MALEQVFQQVTIVTDIVKCYNREVSEKSEIEMLMKDEEFKIGNAYQRPSSFKKAGGASSSTNFELELKITEDL